ncbi:unnamed protein product [Eruca vesicaria subsp. sativa]|uniref:10 kDa chaperonin n=1 Tax=Eruca vesicaria subsp. sativa TaxID=29727 RepID=A0ABC8JE71_ERUVS|nr:unnamed protein product [Eruca vesicaria subsp. sativa]
MVMKTLMSPDDDVDITPLSHNPFSDPQEQFRSLVVRAASVVAPKYTSIKPLGDRVLVKIKKGEEKTMGGFLLPSTAQSKPQGNEVVAVGEGGIIGKNKVNITVPYSGTEVEFNNVKHLILKEDDERNSPSISV